MFKESIDKNHTDMIPIMIFECYNKNKITITK